MARGAFQALADVDDPLRQLFLLIGVGQCRRILESFFERHPEVGGHHLRDAVAVGEGEIQHTRHVAHHGLRLHRPERDDLGHILAPVLLGDVVDHLSAPVLAEVDVDVRRADAFFVQEPLEDQTVLHRIDVGDLERVGHKASRGRTAAGADRDPAILREADEVADDQEVGREADAMDDADLASESRLVIGQRNLEPPRRRERLQHFEPLGEPLAGHLLEEGLGGVARRHVELRELRAGVELELHHVGDLHGVRKRIGHMAEECFHLERTLHIELVGLEGKAIRIRQLLARADAQQHRMRLVVVLMKVVRVVGGHKRQTGFLPDAHQTLVHLGLLRNPVIHQLQVEPVFPEDVAELHDGLDGRSLVVAHQTLRDLARETTRETDQPLAVLSEDFLVDPRPVIEPLGVADRRKLREVVITLVRRRDHPEVVVGIRDAPATLLETRPKRHVALAANDGLDPSLFARRRPPHGPKHRPMVRDGHGLHPHRSRMLRQFV